MSDDILNTPPIKSKHFKEGQYQTFPLKTKHLQENLHLHPEVMQ
jgi:hypothetical protein